MTKLTVALCLVIVVMSSAAGHAAELVLLPAQLRLDGPNARQRCLVVAREGNFSTADLTGRAKFEVQDPKVASVGPNGLVTPLTNGSTVLVAKVGDRVAKIPISVENADRPGSWSFRNHVEAVLTKQGCNSGACHGAAAGKNGFRLTLRGYGPEIDYDVMTRQALGRRIVKTAPAESLLLLKPTGAIEHGGGIKFATDSFDYRVLSEWIADGAKPPVDSDPRVRSLTIYPEAVKLAPGGEQQVVVQAVYSNGRIEDVTHWAKFSSSDDTLARVDENGRIKVEGTGEGAIAVMFGSVVGRVTVTVPSQAKIPSEVFASAPRRNPIDEKNLAKLEALGIPPSPDAGDAAFLRRAYLDLTGTLPPADQVLAFVKDTDSSKRTKLVDRLLDSPEYVDYWTYKWSELFLVSSRKLPPPAMWSFYRFIRKSVAENRPWDQFAREVITAKGSTLTNGASNFFVMHRDPIDLAETSSMAFLGLSLTCARCHNHPLEKWTQDQYYGFASLFSRVLLKDGSTNGDVIVSAAGEGEVVHPRKGVAMAPQPLDGPAVDSSANRDRREVFADWLVRPENPYFAKALVNRVWANFFSRGLIHPEDDLRETNPPSNGPLLDWLIADFVSQGYDLKHLLRTIMTSATYARSSVPVKGNEGDVKFLSHYPVKRLSAEVLLDVISQATEVPTAFSAYPAGWRSLQLPDSKVDSGFLDSFGRPARENTCSCERSSEPSMTQALHLANGTTVNEKLRSEKSAVAKAIAAKQTDDQIVERLFLAALSRTPSAAERKRMTDALASATAGLTDPKAAATARRQAVEDLYWAVLTSNEFLFKSKAETMRCRPAWIVLAASIAATPLVSTPTRAAAPSASVAGSKAISFRETVAPILVRKCLGCHNPQKAASGLDMSTFTRLKKGGKSEGGAILQAGDPDASGLIESISAEANPRMPYKLPPLTDSEISTLKRWVKEGAHFDGPSETETSLASLVDPLQNLPKIAPKVPTLAPVTAVSFSPDSKLLAAASGRSVLIYDAETGKPTLFKDDHPGSLTALRFADKGRVLIAIGGRPAQFGAITGWDLSKQTKLFEVREPGDSFLAADVSPDGTSLATSNYNRLVQLWDTRTGKLIRTLKDHTDAVHGVAFSPDGKQIASCGADRTVKVWDRSTGKKLATLPDATAELYDVAFSPDGKRVFAAGVDRSIRVWSAVEPHYPLIRSVFAHDAAIIRLAISPATSSLASTAEDRSLKLWNLNSLDARTVLSGQPDWVQSVAFTADGKRLAVGRHDGSLALLDAASGKEVASFRQAPGSKSEKPALARNPSLNPPQPRGAARGSKVRLTLTGEGTGLASALIFPGSSGLSGEIIRSSKPDPNRAEVDLTIAHDATPGIHRFTVIGPAGIPGDQPFDVSPFPEKAEQEPNQNGASATLTELPVTLTGTITEPGDLDHFRFHAKPGKQLVFEMVGRSLGSSLRPVLSVLDETGRTLVTAGPADDTQAPALFFLPPREGDFVLAVADADYGGSGNHFYRIRAGEMPRIKSIFPRGVTRGKSTLINVYGVNLHGADSSKVTVPETTPVGTILPVPVQILGIADRPESLKVVVAEGTQAHEQEPNDDRAHAQNIIGMGGVSGRIDHAWDVDTYKFRAQKGQPLIVELFGRRLGTPIDSVIEILDAEGKPIPRAVLRPIDQTEVAFRDHGSKGTGIRLTHWNHLEVNDYLFAGRELMRIVALPRNPDDDCQFYAEDGQRVGMLETTPEHHPMNQPLYRVEVHPPGTKFPAGGNPPITLTYRNDDGGPKLDKDSRLTFVPPADGEYLVRVADVQSAGGTDFAYHLVVRSPRPDYQVSATTNLNIPRGGTRLVSVTLNRMDGFDRPVDVWAEDLPQGIRATGTRINPNELTGTISFTADDMAPAVSSAGWKLVSRPMPSATSAAATASDQRVVDMGGRIAVIGSPNLKVKADRNRVVLRPGEEVSLKLAVDRGPVFAGRVPVDVRNLPQGVRVLNIGLNGVLITEQQKERTVVIRAEPWVKPQSRPFYAVGKAESAGTEDSSVPILLEVGGLSQTSPNR